MQLSYLTLLILLMQTFFVYLNQSLTLNCLNHHYLFHKLHHLIYQFSQQNYLEEMDSKLQSINFEYELYYSNYLLATSLLHCQQNLRKIHHLSWQKLQVFIINAFGLRSFDRRLLLHQTKSKNECLIPSLSFESKNLLGLSTPEFQCF